MTFPTHAIKTNLKKMKTRQLTETDPVAFPIHSIPLPSHSKYKSKKSGVKIFPGMPGCAILREYSWCFFALALFLAGVNIGMCEPKPPFPKGCKLIEGDIQVPEGFTFSGPSTKAVYADNLWPGGVVPYELDDNVTEGQRWEAMLAMKVWESVANVSFRSKDLYDLYYIHIQDSTKNSSPVGRNLFSHTVNIADWNTFIIAHELGHTLGFWHEQSRSDRDTYVTINWDNIIPDEEHNFDKHDEASHYGPYDFDSLMHYGACDFSIDDNCNCSGTPSTLTITVKPAYQMYQCLIGQTDHLSAFDALTMSFLYPYSNWRFVDVNYSGSEQGTFIEPFNTFSEGAEDVPSEGTVWLQPGTYSAVGAYTKPMILKAPLGGVLLGD